MNFSSSLAALLSLTLAMSAASHGQSVSTTIGGSQTYSAYGLQTEFKWRNISGWTGLGFNHGPKVGAYINVPLARGYQLGAGDQMLSGYLDVDDYDSHAFTVRGVSLSRRTKTDNFEIFTGLLSQDYEYPFLHMSTTTAEGLSATRLIAMLYSHKLSDTFRIHALTLYGSKVTSIESITWMPSKRWRLAGAAGIGSGDLYFAGKSEAHFQKADSSISYTIAGPNFHRQEQFNYGSEAVGLNARLALTPIPSLKLTLDHEKSRMYMASLPSVTGTFDSARLYASLKGFQLSTSVGTVSTSNLPGSTLTEMISVSRTILPKWRAFGAYINMKSPTFKQSTIVTTNEVKVNPRLAIRQNYNRMNGQNNFSFGAQWLSNRISFSVDQQVYISPLAPAFGAKSVFQAWTFNVRLRTPHGTSSNLNTFVSPDGHMQWGGYLSGLRYNAVAPAADSSPGFSKYLVSGLVVDESGKGVWGIAVQIGSELVISDSDGTFFVHVKNPKPQALSVVPDSSLQTSRWVLTSAPATAHGFLDDKPNDPLRVVVQMGRSVVAQETNGTRIIDPQNKPNAISSSVEPRNPQGSMSAIVQKPVKSAVLEPQVESSSISSSIQPHDLQLAILTAQKTESNQTSEPRQPTEPLTASIKSPDLGIPKHFVIEKSSGITVYEPARRATEASVNIQASELQSAVHALQADPTMQPEKTLEQHRPKKSNSVWHSIGGYLSAPERPKDNKS